jgi:hypothetical protein
MQIPGKDKGPDNPPPGGRAFERIQQDRKARGLDKLPTPGTEDAESSSEKDAPNEQTPKKGK